MIMSKYLWLTILLTILACNNDEPVNCYNKELLEVSFGFETSLEDWVDMGGSGEREFDSDITIVDSISFEGSRSVQFTVSPDSYVNGGNRAELTFDQQIEDGDETTYEYSLFIPQDYQDVASMRADNGAPNWQVMGQWHDQPDLCLNQSWDDIEGKSPPIGVYYNYLTQSDKEYQAVLNDPSTPEIFGVDMDWDEVSTISLVYNERVVALYKVNKGEWIRLKFRIKWSTEDDGFVEAWVNDLPFTNGRVTEPNMHNKASHYFKFGLYRNPNIPFTNKLLYDDIRIY